MAGRTLRIVAVALGALLLAPTLASAQTTHDPVPQPMQLNVKNASVLEVLKLIAEAGGFDIVIGEGVKGGVTLAVDDMAPRDLLDIVVGVVDAAYVSDNGAVWVMTRDRYEARYGEPFVDNRISRTITLEQADVKDVLPSVKALLGDRAVVKPDLAGNRVTVKGSRALVKEAVSMLRALDAPRATRSFELHSLPAEMAAGLIGKMASDQASIIEDPVNGRLVISASAFELERLADAVELLDAGGGLETAVLEVHYAQPDTLAEALRPHLTPDLGRLYADARSRRLLVTDVPPVVETVTALAEAFDVPQRQVLLEAKILQVTTSREYRSGINWTAVEDKVNVTGTFPTLIGDDPGLRGDFGELSSLNYEVVVEALETYGDTDLLSSPRLMVIDGGSGLIHVGSQVPYTTVDSRETPSGSFTQFEQVVVIDVGVKLDVQVEILGDDMVRLKIRPEVSSVTGYSEDDIPIVDAATTDSELLVENGNTVILGGLIKDESRKVRKGVPLLASIPLLKYLFSSNVEETYKSELVILLTPRIMTGREPYQEGG